MCAKLRIFKRKPLTGVGRYQKGMISICGIMIMAMKTWVLGLKRLQKMLADKRYFKSRGQSTLTIIRGHNAASLGVRPHFLIRRKRNRTLYDTTGAISIKEAGEAVETAKDFVT